MAYTRNLFTDIIDSHQTSPAYLLTFTRYRNRDTQNYTLEDAFDTRNPLVVINDATSIQISGNKSSPSHNFSCSLKQGDLNYLTAVSPGDYVIVNLVNSEEKALELRQRALSRKPINRYKDGFKGLFKIIDVRMQLSVAPNGNKQYVVNVTGRAFDEFNNMLYFNPAFTEQENESFKTNNFDKWDDIIIDKKRNNIQNLIKETIKRTIGIGLKVLDKPGADLNETPIYKVPSVVAKLLNKGQKNHPFISRINNYYLGIWTKPIQSSGSNIEPKTGFNNFFQEDPLEKESGKNKKKEDELKTNWFTTKTSLKGTRGVVFTDFSNVNVWSLVKDYSNPILNETYTCFRVAKDGYVYPSLICRQKPFNTPSYIKKMEKNGDVIADHTQFLDVPRWRVPGEAIYSIDLGRSDAARINFVQIFTRSIALDENFNQALQIAGKNYVVDEKDIERNGRKPFIQNCNYDFPKEENLDKQEELTKTARIWTNLVADWVMGGHLKMNGTMVCAGIEEPICIGDNLEFDNIVYSIESISHNLTLMPNGNKRFVTTITLSMGMSKDSNKNFPVYAEMDHTDSYKRRLDDYSKEGVLPGFSDTQDIPGTSRVKGEEVKETRQATFTNPKGKQKNKKKK